MKKHLAIMPVSCFDVGTAQTDGFVEFAVKGA